MNERWVCKRCFADNDDAAGACHRCGLIRGADSSQADNAQWAASTAAAPEGGQPGGWQQWLRFWWIPAVVIALAVGYFTTAQRGDDGSLSTSGTVTVDDLRVGDCFNSTDEGEISDVDGVPCAEPHAYEVLAVADYNGSVYPATDAQLDQAFGEVCLPPFEAYVGLPYEESVLYLSAITPTEDGWNQGDREFICYLFEQDEGMVTGSQRNSNR